MVDTIVTFQASRRGGVIAFIDGYASFPDRGWEETGHPLPEVGEEWLVRVVGRSPKGTRFLAPVRRIERYSSGSWVRIHQMAPRKGTCKEARAYYSSLATALVMVYDGGKTGFQFFAGEALFAQGKYEPKQISGPEASFDLFFRRGTEEEKFLSRAIKEGPEKVLMIARALAGVRRFEVSLDGTKCRRPGDDYVKVL